jgi:threonine synthase
MSKSSYTNGLKCRECGARYDDAPVHVCEFCFGPLEVEYDYDAIGKTLTREVITQRPNTMWRYRELLPVNGEPSVGTGTGFTPLIRADRLAERLGVREVWLKNDTVNHPTLSFKDRVVSVALSRAVEFGFDTVACASTGNLANSVAANAAAAGLRCFVFIPSDLESGKIIGSLVYGANVVGVRGTYDQVNRLSAEIADRYGWGFVNINLRPYYAEGSKTVGYEIAEQLGWKTPDHVVVPMAGGSLITKIHKSFHELALLNLIEETPTKIHGAQPQGCAPIVNTVQDDSEHVRPVEKPNTVVKSLAIGNPADGYYATDVIRNSGGWGENPTDEETVAGIRLLAETEGVFAETAGGCVVASTRRLIESGKINRDESIVLCITGNGLKTREVLDKGSSVFAEIDPALSDFENAYDGNQTPAYSQISALESNKPNQKATQDTWSDTCLSTSEYPLHYEI